MQKFLFLGAGTSAKCCGNAKVVKVPMTGAERISGLVRMWD
jgi:hypothetical protein